MNGGGRKFAPQAGLASPSSLSRQINGKRQISLFNATRHLRPTCGAKAKSTGEPCRDLAMGNGRCFRHGGRTPKGKQWHQPLWPDRDAPNAMDKLHRKVASLTKAAKRRERKIAAMSDDERADYEKWKRSHKPGSPADRARARAERKQNSEARSSIARMQAPPPTAEAVEEPSRDEKPTQPFEGAFA